MNNNDINNNQQEFVEYDASDMEYFGAIEVISHEKQHIIKRQGLADKTDDERQEYFNSDLSGIALSGGGIRSASFCLGVLQALSYNRWLKHIDYISSVSGGGYIGTSLNWLLSNDWQKASVGVDRENFPYGTYPMRGNIQPMTSAEKEDTVEGGPPRLRGALLRFLRQHGKYLIPGSGIGSLSLAGVILRGTLLSLFIYFSMLVLLFSLVGQTFLFQWFTDFGIMPPSPLLSRIPNIALLLALLLIVLFVLSALLYSLAAFFLSLRGSKHASVAGDVKNHHHDTSHNNRDSNFSYGLRRVSESVYTHLFRAIMVLVVFGVLPLWYQSFIDGAGVVSTSAASTGVLLIVTGIICAVATFIKTSNISAGRVPLGLLVAVSTITLWAGLLLLAYHCSLLLPIDSGWAVLLVILVAVFGWFSNLNYISVHRYYRDRLMEAFMPDLDQVVEYEHTPNAASAKADKTKLSAMCRYDRERPATHNLPYHIINANIVLVSSSIAKFRGRGGDNFILTPAYCGSNATGWRETSSFMQDRMTLATAMAISGAAVNPSTGVGGDGVSRKPFLSMLMGMLNVRLGYWAPNPDPHRQPFFSIPNLFLPGLSELAFRQNLNEKSRFIQLTDGGHFENLGLYELVRRKVRLIIVCDSTADADCAFEDLSNALEKIRADFGVLIDINSEQLQDVIPEKTNDNDGTRYARRGFIMANIIYPDGIPGRLLYLKSTFFKKLSADLFGYRQSHQEFPDEPSSTAVFDEKQFESYRELGFQTAWDMMNDPDVKNDAMISRIFGR
ncbi:MAG: patatin-like phospholipase family protein [Gammaproteobacteria bacterium]|jgi:hypothetical protein